VTVYLVGAGPGDPGLVTARALELVAAADVIVYDRLIPAGMLDGARPDAELVYVGKEGGGPSVPQPQAERMLIDRGSAGKLVVRLKGGDPFVFGRGGEEGEALQEAGVPFEVVPGVTAGVAAPAYAGIPVTHRDLASAVAFVTGHEDPEKGPSALDWGALAAFPGTLVVYMGVRRLAAICEALLAAGRDRDQPAAVIERGTMPEQRVVTATLETLADAAAAENVRAPAIAVFGRVAAMRESLRWFENRPLFGVSVVVTRARAQASQLVLRLRSLGAEVIEAPAIRIVAREFELPELGRYDLVCLTSPNGVRVLFDRMDAASLDARALAGCIVAAIGPGTAGALRERGVLADVVPERFVAEGLIDALAGIHVERALIARAAGARDVLVDALRERGTEVDVLELYETLAEAVPEPAVAEARSARYITFTSSSTVRFFLDAVADGVGASTRVVSIGPVTSAALRERGISPDVEASRHDIDGLIQAILADARSGER
jgi:uroporphyrinogen III methyltransferase / synthase